MAVDDDITKLEEHQHELALKREESRQNKYWAIAVTLVVLSAAGCTASVFNDSTSGEDYRYRLCVQNLGEWHQKTGDCIK